MSGRRERTLCCDLRLELPPLFERGETIGAACDQWLLWTMVVMVDEQWLMKPMVVMNNDWWCLWCLWLWVMVLSNGCYDQWLWRMVNGDKVRVNYDDGLGRENRDLPTITCIFHPSLCHVSPSFCKRHMCRMCWFVLSFDCSCCCSVCYFLFFLLNLLSTRY